MHSIGQTIMLSNIQSTLLCCLLAGTVREYCLREYFVPSCSGVGDVILMTSALYGRMRIGRCIRGTFNDLDLTQLPDLVN